KGGHEDGSNICEETCGKESRKENRCEEDHREEAGGKEKNRCEETCGKESHSEETCGKESRKKTRCEENSREETGRQESSRQETSSLIKRFFGHRKIAFYERPGSRGIPLWIGSFF
ncbi:MAG: hypothetical protein FWB77_04920, partial [Treponema sp.]|nr:hypothetical protein [Treponema sp.]